MYKYFIYIFVILIIVIIFTFCIWCLSKKRRGICPFCVIKQYMCKSKLTIKINENEFYDSGDAKTPPMGWSSWNTFRNQIDENLIYETALAMKNTGLLDAGYKYINLDDCWHSSKRDDKGRLQGDLSRFSSGISSLTNKLNNLGFKVGLYSSNGDYTCEDLPASLNNEYIDANTFAQWGIEYFKYDFCHNIKIPSAAPLVEKVEIKFGEKTVELSSDDVKLTGLAKIIKNNRLDTGKCIGFLGHGKGRAIFSLKSDEAVDVPLTLVVNKVGRFEKYIVIKVNDNYYEMFIPFTKSFTPTGRYQCVVSLNKGENTIEMFNPVCTRADSAYIQYKRMGEALKIASGDKKITYSICEWGRNKPEKWAWNTGNLWRTTPDIRPIWQWINIIYNANLKLSEFAGSGHWNDPDMLEVGNGKLTFEENKTHFSLWCMMAAPLILGNDIRQLSNHNNEETLNILKNKDMIAINQDIKGCQCVRYMRTFTADFLVKDLTDGDYAVCIYNKTNSERNIVFDSDKLPKHIHKKKIYKEVWSKNRYDGDNFSFNIKSHGCVVLTTKV